MDQIKMQYYKILKEDMGLLKEKWKILTGNIKMWYLNNGVWIVYYSMNSVPSRDCIWQQHYKELMKLLM